VAPPRAWKPLRAPAAAPRLELLHFTPFVAGLRCSVLEPRQRDPIALLLV